MKKLKVTGDLYESFVRVKYEIDYQNIDLKNLVECSFEFPLVEKVIVKGISVKINGMTILSEIMEKEEAKQTYEDEITKGSLAFVGASEKLKQKMVLKLGNLLPGASCQLTLETIQEIEFSGGSFMYVLPSSFVPDYTKHLR
jgi:hypothetical protein